MIRNLAHTLRRIAVILVAVGVVTLGAYAFSMSPLASSLSEAHGGPPAAMTTMTDTSVATSDIVLVDYVSAESSTTDQTTDSATATAATTAMQRPMMGEGGHDSSGSVIQLVQSAAPNVGILFAVSAAVAVIQTALKRRKKTRKLTLTAA